MDEEAAMAAITRKLSDVSASIERGASALELLAAAERERIDPLSLLQDTARQLYCQHLAMHAPTSPTLLSDQPYLRELAYQCWSAAAIFTEIEATYEDSPRQVPGRVPFEYRPPPLTAGPAEPH